jgi:hypothetical protein
MRPPARRAAGAERFGAPSGARRRARRRQPAGRGGGGSSCRRAGRSVAGRGPRRSRSGRASCAHPRGAESEQIPAGAAFNTLICRLHDMIDDMQAKGARSPRATLDEGSRVILLCQFLSPQ